MDSDSQLERSSHPTSSDLASTLTYAVADQIHCRDGRLLGVASNVGRDEGQDRHEWHGGRLGEVVAGQSALAVLQGKTNNERDAHDRQHETHGCHEQTVPVSVTQEAAHDQRDDLNGAARSAIEKRLLGSVAETLDQLAEEVGNTAVGNIGDKSIEEERPL